MKIGIICNHFSFPAINYLLSNNLVAGFAVPEAAGLASQNIKLISEPFHPTFNILQKETLKKDITNGYRKSKPTLFLYFPFLLKYPAQFLIFLDMDSLIFIQVFFLPTVDLSPCFGKLKMVIPKQGLLFTSLTNFMMPVQYFIGKRRTLNLKIHMVL